MFKNKLFLKFKNKNAMPVIKSNQKSCLKICNANIIYVKNVAKNKTANVINILTKSKLLNFIKRYYVIIASSKNPINK